MAEAVATNNNNNNCQRDNGYYCTCSGSSIVQPNRIRAHSLYEYECQRAAEEVHRDRRRHRRYRRRYAAAVLLHKRSPLE